MQELSLIGFSVEEYIFAFVKDDIRPIIKYGIKTAKKDVIVKFYSSLELLEEALIDLDRDDQDKRLKDAINVCLGVLIEFGSGITYKFLKEVKKNSPYLKIFLITEEAMAKREPARLLKAKVIDRILTRPITYQHIQRALLSEEGSQQNLLTEKIIGIPPAPTRLEVPSLTLTINNGKEIQVRDGDTIESVLTLNKEAVSKKEVRFIMDQNKWFIETLVNNQAIRKEIDPAKKTSLSLKFDLGISTQ